MAELLQTEQVHRLQLKANLLLFRMDQLSKRLGFRFMGPAYLLPSYGKIDGDTSSILSYTGSTVVLGSESHKFTFRKEDSAFVNYFSTSISELNDGAGSPVSDKPDQPQWRQEQVIQAATKFRDAMWDKTGIHLGYPRAQYDHDIYDTVKVKGKSVTKARPGIWRVWWPRTDSKGHPFYGDGVTISLSEKYGLMGASFQLFTPFDEQKTAPLSYDIALHRARVHIAWTATIARYLASFATDPYETITGDKPISANLMVVLPNGYASSPSAELAWVIWFKPTHKAPPSSPTYDDRFAVWVDATTGEIIGGDAML